eukprot:1839832-Rhodomonas_salina.1
MERVKTEHAEELRRAMATKRTLSEPSRANDEGQDAALISSERERMREAQAKELEKVEEQIEALKGQVRREQEQRAVAEAAMKSLLHMLLPQVEAVQQGLVEEKSRMERALAEIEQMQTKHAAAMLKAKEEHDGDRLRMETEHAAEVEKMQERMRAEHAEESQKAVDRAESEAEKERNERDEETRRAGV